LATFFYPNDIHLSHNVKHYIHYCEMIKVGQQMVHVLYTISFVLNRIFCSFFFYYYVIEPEINLAIWSGKKTLLPGSP